jgi:hypothetical protein|tara:strand:- start:50 stop:526 length:477 start_codon:yes stop_codon:yes gene_type:complete
MGSRTIKRISLIFFLTLFLFNCASITQGSDQIIAVDTPNCPGAQCKLTNNDGTYFINGTPGTVTINKSRSQLSIECYKGKNKSIASSSSSVENMAWGNILIGGIIGGGVDMATGAAYKYPGLISHPLDCRDQEESSSNLRDDEIKELQRRLDKLKEEN